MFTIRAEFVYDDRLGIPLPKLERDWEDYPERDRAEMLAEWEEIRGRIPERILTLEKVIVARQDRLNVEEDFAAACLLNSEIAELASIVSDLHIWYRINQEVSVGKGHN